ncbi:dTMP kinase [Streptomyces sp. NPDC056437]|uniref:dTMP kinase n=1 Tax=Streptomyces sp. NPDC056437 TaxID=3345816 RepID=UPI0036BDB8A9
MTRGLFVAVDGPGGVGKSTVTGLVAQQLQDQGVRVLATREPIDAPLGDLARHSTEEYRGEAMACLMAAGRYQHGEEICAALESGEVVVCDRYIASSLALQRMDGVDPDFVWLLNERVTMPHLTVLITAQPDVIAKRLADRGTHSRYERMDGSSHIECAYFHDAGRFIRDKGLRVLDVDATQASPEEVARTIVATITRLRKDYQPHGAERADVQPQQPVPGACGATAPVPGGPPGAGPRAHGGGAQRRMRPLGQALPGVRTPRDVPPAPSAASAA